MTFWSRLKIAILFLKLVRNPNRTDLIFQGVSIAGRPENRALFTQVEEAVLKDSEFRGLYESQYLPREIAQESLSKLPEGSFGRALDRHLKENGLQLDLFPRFKPQSLFDYISARLYFEHDLWHALLGCGVSVEDELVIQAFAVGQFNSPVGTLIITGGLLHLLIKDPKGAVRAIGAVAKGFSTGRKARLLLGIPLYELLAEPLEEVRRRCQLT